MGEAVLAAAAAFAATNLDDLLVLMLLFGQAEGRAQRRKICLGQLLGIGALTAVSILFALGLGLMAERHLRWLGLVPILLGLRALWDREAGSEARSAVGVLGTVALTVANGGDNLGVYIPLFAGYTPVRLLVCAAVFAVMTLLWCLLGSRLAALPRVRETIRRYKGLLVPAVLILLGLTILL